MYIKQKYNEYTRRDVNAFERQIKGVIDDIFASVNTTNIRKSFYKKKDLVGGGTFINQEEGAEDGATIYDSHGEELMDHTSKNTMNEMILANNAKNAPASSNSVLGKRARASQDGTEDPEGGAQKRRKK